MATVAMLIGIPGSGKSTWAQLTLIEAEDIRYISTDEIREKRFGDATDMSHNKQVFQIMKDELVRALQKGESVILDATFVKRAERRPYILVAKDFEAQVVAYFVKTSIDEALKRNANRMRKVPPDVIRVRYAQLEEPVEEEGFDRIIVVQGGI